MHMVNTFRLEEFGFEVEVGKVANQANGAVWFTSGGTVLLATVTQAPTKDFPGFLPLTIDYREHYSAAGKIPGGYYKREGKSSDREVLIGRLIDRALRPLFPERFFNQVQILVTVYSVDKEHSPNVIALIASSLALAISDIPFLESVGAVEMARVDGAWIVNPLYPDSLKADARVVVAGTHDGICMVEASSNEIPEQEFIDVLFTAHAEIKKIVAWQNTIVKQIGKSKKDIDDVYHWQEWCSLVKTFLTQDRVKGAFIKDKVEREAYLSTLRQEFLVQQESFLIEKETPTSVIEYIFDYQLKEQLTNVICSSGQRIDGRKFDIIRPISIQVGLLPFAHGSALFTRGNTQALVSVTLGSGQDEQRMESIMDGNEDEGSFLLHYNFPPFSVGEVRPMRGPGRRDVGHGYLAASAFRYVRPSKAEFPYTIRIVSDILESDGSSSQATICGSTMALMQTGVPIKKMVAGIAMGLLIDSNNENFVVLSDMSGFEDAFGLMDFKVAGTHNGITAVQMDIKYKKGLPRALFESALEQARVGRLHILGEMGKVMDKPNAKLSDLVPRVATVKIETDKIGAVIGSGGKTIREITEKTNTSIDIDQDGLVKIFGVPGANIDQAINWVKTLTGQIERGTIYTGKIRKVADFGIFVELVPGQDGLVHVSNIPRAIQKTFSQVYKVGDVVTVEVLDHDEVTGRTSLRIKENTTN